MEKQLGTSSVDEERLYQHVLNLEGIRNPLQDMDTLNSAKQYIENKFRSYGLSTSLQELYLDSFSIPFYNIEGVLKGSQNSTFIISGHYDSVINCPGAFDNASAIAIMLECARILSKKQNSPTIKFVAFTLEEFNPAWIQKRFQKLQKLKLMNKSNRYLSLKIAETMRKYKKQTWRYRQEGLSPSEAIRKFLNENDEQLTIPMKEFLQFDMGLYDPYDQASIWGESVLYGSEKWLHQKYEENKNIKGVLNLDALGFRSLHSTPHSAIKEHKKSNHNDSNENKTAQNQNIHDLLIISNDQSQNLSNGLCLISKERSFPLRLLQVYAQGSFDNIAKNQPDLLRSDHTSFWNGLPAIFLTDFSEMPNPYYHTPADTIDKLDFSLLTQITQLLIEFIISKAN